jgi:hypothetical protein
MSPFLGRIRSFGRRICVRADLPKSRFTEEQIIKVLKEHAAGLSAGDVCRKVRHQRCDVLQLAFALWRDGGLRCPQAERAGGREPPTEEAARRDDADASTLQEMLGKNLTPGLRKRAVTWAIREKNYSQRRACGLVGLHPKTYRYATKRLAMKSFAGGCESLPHNGDGLAIVALV